MLLAKELLHESGSCFVQISDENVHHVRELMDEVFGAENFISLIYFTKTTGGLQAQLLSRATDFLFGMQREVDAIKYRSLSREKLGGAG